jgi:hypothetical protein
MSEFQERLWLELVRDHAGALAHPAGVRDPSLQLPILERRGVPRVSLPSLRPRQLLGVLTAVVVLAAVVTIATVTSSTSSAAYAVTTHPDGTVVVTINELTGIAGANAQLERLGVPVRVVAVQAGCPISTTIVPTPPSLSGTIAHIEGRGLATRPDLVPSGETLVLSAHQAGTNVFLSYGLYRGAAPNCVAMGK